jgi:hypothetical protein
MCSWDALRRLLHVSFRCQPVVPRRRLVVDVLPASLTDVDDGPAKAAAQVHCSCVQDAAPRRVQMAVAGFAAAALLAAQMPVEAADVKTVVCASNPTSKICLKVSSTAHLRATKLVHCCAMGQGCLLEGLCGIALRGGYWGRVIKGLYSQLVLHPLSSLLQDSAKKGLPQPMQQK